MSSGYDLLTSSCSILVSPEVLSDTSIAERLLTFRRPRVPVLRGPDILVHPGLPLLHLGVKRSTPIILNLVMC